MAKPQRLPSDLLASTEPVSRKKSAKRGQTTVAKTRGSKGASKRDDGTTPPIEAATSVGEPMARMTLVLRADQLRWLRRQAFEAQDRGERSDMSAIVRGLIDDAISD